MQIDKVQSVLHEFCKKYLTHLFTIFAATNCPEKAESFNDVSKSTNLTTDQDLQNSSRSVSSDETRKSCLKVNSRREVNTPRTVSFEHSKDKSSSVEKEQLKRSSTAPSSQPATPACGSSKNSSSNDLNDLSENNAEEFINRTNGQLEPTAAAVLTVTAAAASASHSRLQLRHVQHCNERRRIFEDNLAAVCMGFVLVFLVCHFPRLLLNIHELITIEEAMKCGDNGHHPFSVWSMVTISISHFLLVLNSATNILVYCLLSSKFREECSKIFGGKNPLFRRRTNLPQQRRGHGSSNTALIENSQRCGAVV